MKNVSKILIVGIVTVVAVSVTFCLCIGKKSDLCLFSSADRLSFQRLIEDKGITKRSLGNSAISMAESQKPLKGIEFFWDSFDFSHKSYVAQPELLKQPAINFINILAEQPEHKEIALNMLMDKVLDSDTSIVQYMMEEIFEKYLFSPDSPVRSDDDYLLVLNRLLKSSRLNKVEKFRFEYQQMLIQQNRVGSVANNFSFVTKDNKSGDLFGLQSEYLILYFNNPDCNSCANTTRALQYSPLLNKALELGKLILLSIYPDNELSTWEMVDYPKMWLNAYSNDLSLEKNNGYDLRAIPSIYLLDNNKRVLIKDGAPDEILNLLSRKL